MSKSQQLAVDSDEPKRTRHRNGRLIRHGHGGPNKKLSRGYFDGNRSNVSTSNIIKSKYSSFREQKKRIRQIIHIQREAEAKAKRKRASKAKSCKAMSSLNSGVKSSVIPTPLPDSVPGPSGSHINVVNTVNKVKKKVLVRKSDKKKSNFIISINKDKKNFYIEHCTLIRLRKLKVRLSMIDSKNKNHQYIHKEFTQYMNINVPIVEVKTETENKVTEIEIVPSQTPPRSILSCKKMNKNKVADDAAINHNRITRLQSQTQNDITEMEIVQKPAPRSILSCKNKYKNKNKVADDATANNRITRSQSQNRAICLHKVTKSIKKTVNKLPVPRSIKKTEKKLPVPVPVHVPRTTIITRTTTTKSTRPVITTTKLIVKKEKAQIDDKVQLPKPRPNAKLCVTFAANVNADGGNQDGHLIVSPSPMHINNNDNDEDNQNINNIYSLEVSAAHLCHKSIIIFALENPDPCSNAEAVIEDNNNLNRNHLRIIENDNGDPINCCAIVIKEPDVNDLLDVIDVDLEELDRNRKTIDLDMDMDGDSSDDDSDDGLDFWVHDSDDNVDHIDLEQCIMQHELAIERSQEQDHVDSGNEQSPESIIKEIEASASTGSEQVIYNSDSDNSTASTSSNLIPYYDKYQSQEEQYEQEGNSDTESIEPFISLQLVSFSEEEKEERESTTYK